MLFEEKIGPVIFKEESSLERYVFNLNELLKCSDGSILKKDIEEELFSFKKGLDGENNVIYNLVNSDIDMYILHDVNLSYEDLHAQIDFIVITRKKVYIIECKNFDGNIKVKSSGDFVNIRPNSEKGDIGFTSPITQNDIHMNVVKKVRCSSRKNTLSKELFDHFFETNYYSLVVFTDKNTVLDLTDASEEIKSKVIRSDNLISKIKEIDSAEKQIHRSKEEMLELANFFKQQNNEEKITEDLLNLLSRFKSKRLAELENKINVTSSRRCPMCGSNLVIKVATKGERLGKKFFGCSSYPNCNFIENIDKE